MGGYRVISSDSHVFEPPDLWTSRIDPEYRDRCPRVMDTERGPMWAVEGRKQQGFGQGTEPGKRFDEPEKMDAFGEWEDVRPGGYDPVEAVKDLDIDGVDVSVTYPSIGLFLYCTTRNSELFTAICHTYNDWLGEFCSGAPKRLKGIAMLNVDDVSIGVEEMERCAKLGFVGAMIPVQAPEGMRYDLPEYDPLWAAAQDLEMPISLHITTNRIGPDPQEWESLKSTTYGLAKHMLINGDHWVKMSISDMIFSGVFDRFPKLRVGSVEHELSWVPYFVMRLDWLHNLTPVERGGHKFNNDMLPSEVFRQNIFVDLQEDGVGIELRHKIGIDNILWGSDYPHHESTFPRSHEILEDILSDCTEEEKAKIAGGNAARIYRL